MEIKQVLGSEMTYKIYPSSRKEPGSLRQVYSKSIQQAWDKPANPEWGLDFVRQAVDSMVNVGLEGLLLKACNS